MRLAPKKIKKNQKISKILTKSQAFKFTIARKPPKKLKKTQKKIKKETQTKKTQNK